MSGWNDYGSAETRALRGISNRSEKPNSDLEKNLGNLNQSVRYMSQMMTVMQNGIDDANRDILQKIQDAIEDLMIIFGLSGGDTLSFDWGDLSVVLNNLSRIFQLDLLNAPFEGLNLAEVGENIWNLLFGWISLDVDFDGLLAALKGEYSGPNVALTSIQQVAKSFSSILQGGPLVNLGQLTTSPINLLPSGTFDTNGTVLLGEGWSHDPTVGRTSPGSALFTATGEAGVLYPPAPAEVEAGKKYTGKISVQWDITSGSSPDVFHPVIRWYDIGDSLISETVMPTISNPSNTGGWVDLKLQNVTAPAGARWGRVLPQVKSGVFGKIWWDDAGLWAEQQTLPQTIIEGLADSLQGVIDWVQALVDSLLGALGIPATGSLFDRINDLSDEIEGLSLIHI